MTDSDSGKRTDQLLSEFESTVSHIPWKKAVTIGLISGIIVFAIIFSFVLIEEAFYDEPFEDDVIGEEEPTMPYWSDRIFMFFSAHFVETHESGEFRDMEFSNSFNLIEHTTETIPEPLYYLVPILVLIYSGYYFVDRHDDFVESNVSHFFAGSSIGVGYAVIVFAFLLISPTELEAYEYASTVQVRFISGILVAGILYPAIFGGIGGYISYLNTLKPD